MNSPLDLSAFDAAWRTRWPDCRPIGHELRSSAHETWVRFHSLPESKRYAESEVEYEELLTRHFTLLRELSSSAFTPPDDLRLITVAWSESPEQAERDSDLQSAFPEGHYWQSVAYDLSDPDYPVWTHLYVGSTALDAEELRSLLMLVADDGTSDVVICPPGGDWLYHPYDGGGDVIAPDHTTRDILRDRHADWLPANPHGL
ncbi:hypothetical protein [Mycetocola sp.]|uniref:DUF3885 domain-containing protein n=1 Tax=Mycetocola sp. TaxID=1871042 RepID=UPI0039897ED2